jgi:hypothetical protein
MEELMGLLAKAEKSSALLRMECLIKNRHKPTNNPQNPRVNP